MSALGLHLVLEPMECRCELLDDLSFVQEFLVGLPVLVEDGQS